MAGLSGNMISVWIPPPYFVFQGLLSLLTECLETGRKYCKLGRRTKLKIIFLRLEPRLSEVVWYKSSKRIEVEVELLSGKKKPMSLLTRIILPVITY